MLFFVLAFFIAVNNAACLTDPTVDTQALAAVPLCAQTALLNNVLNTATIKAAAVCSCVQTYATAVQPNCDANTLGVATSCAAGVILDTAFAVANYDFGTSCSICANPPASPLFPTACTTCYMKYVACLTTGFFDAKAHTSIKDRLSPNATCKCLGQFWSCANTCGSPLSQFVGNLCAAHNYCPCDGSLNVADSSKVIAFLKTQGFTTFSVDIVAQSSGSVLSIDCVTLSAQAGIANDRFLCDVNFASNSPDYASFHVWVTNYLGRNAQVALGAFLNGPVISLKRDSQEAMVSSTYTFVMDGNSGSVLSATFSLFLVLGAILVLLF